MKSHVAANHRRTGAIVGAAEPFAILRGGDRTLGQPSFSATANAHASLCVSIGPARLT